MIVSLAGTIQAKGDRFVVVSLGLIALKVFGHARMLHAIGSIGDRVSIPTHLEVREASLELFGFLTESERDFFELLISVSGVGPRSALAILDVAELKHLRAAIRENRPDVLTRASGIGRKTAERIIVELRTKVDTQTTEGIVEAFEADADILEALAGLGYRRDEARDALRKVPDGITGVEARLKEVLKVLKKS